MGLLLTSFAIAVLPLIQAATVTYDFNVTWVVANPDKAFPRSVVGINGQWPVPTIEVNKGDRLVVNVQNQLGNASTGLHFHGMYQNGTTEMDGAVGVTQCTLKPKQRITYNFTVDQPGTYWYHSHELGQYPDGLRGPLIVHDLDSPYKDKYDEEVVLYLSDWYHTEMPQLIKKFMSVTNPTGAEPVPNTALINDSQNITTTVKPSKTYFFRIINVGAFAAHYVWFEDHSMRIIEVDGVYVDEAETQQIYVAAAQRYGVLVTMKDDASANFPYVASMDQDLFDAVPPGLNPNTTGWLVYDDKAKNPDPKPIDAFEPFDDFTLVPQDKTPLLDKVDHSLTLDFKMDNLGDGANYAFFNDKSYVFPKVPSLYTAMSSGSLAQDASIYGGYTNAFVLKKNDVVEIVLNNMDPGKHPFHLHGHAFQVVVRSKESAGVFVNNETLPATPMQRDTVAVHPNGNVVLRFRADNPGVWLFHCHIQWHFISGLIATMIEAPDVLQQTLKIPDDHYEVCRSQVPATPTVGNAAGNSKDFLNLKGQREPPAPLPEGFTPRGIVALTFSIVAALIGVWAISWYGVGEIGKAKA